MSVIPIKMVLCDVGNVLVLADHAHTHAKLMEYGVSEATARRFYQNDDYPAFSTGEIDEEQFWKRLVTHLQHPLAYEQVVEALHAQIYSLDQAVFDLLLRLKVPLAFATDTNPWQDERVAQLVRLENLGRVIKSHQLGMLKHDPGTFLVIVRLLSRESGEILLIDDSPEKIARAVECGMQTHLFVDATSLELDLLRRGLLKPT